MFNYCGTLKIMILKQTKYDDWFVCFLFLFFWIEINFGYLLSRNIHVKSPLFEITSPCFASNDYWELATHFSLSHPI